MRMDDLAIVILAAGKGTRMKSDLAKVLHPIAGKSMVNHVVECARTVAGDHIHVVVGHQADRVRAEVSQFHPAHFAVQKELLGTGDAVKAALPGLAECVRNVLVLCGDVPLIRKDTLRDLVQAHKSVKSEFTVLAVNVNDPGGYGRIITDKHDGLVAIREEADASGSEKEIKLVNAGIYCFGRRFLETGITLLRNTNNQAEYYLTDLAEIAVLKCVKTLVQSIDDPSQVMGVNTLEQLSRAENLFRETPNELP